MIIRCRRWTMSPLSCRHASTTTGGSYACIKLRGSKQAASPFPPDLSSQISDVPCCTVLPVYRVSFPATIPRVTKGLLSFTAVLHLLRLPPPMREKRSARISPIQLLFFRQLTHTTKQMPLFCMRLRTFSWIGHALRKYTSSVRVRVSEWTRSHLVDRWQNWA